MLRIDLKTPHTTPNLRLTPTMGPLGINDKKEFTANGVVLNEVKPHVTDAHHISIYIDMKPMQAWIRGPIGWMKELDLNIELPYDVTLDDTVKYIDGIFDSILEKYDVVPEYNVEQGMFPKADKAFKTIIAMMRDKTMEDLSECTFNQQHIPEGDVVRDKFMAKYDAIGTDIHPSVTFRSRIGNS